MNRSTAIDHAGTIERAAEIVTAGTSMFTPEQLAGQYAFDATRQGEGNTNNTQDVTAHLDALADAGAVFNYSEALDTAMEFAKQHDNT